MSVNTIVKPVPDDRIYRGLLGRATEAVADYSEAEPIAILTSLMALLATYIGPNAKIESRGTQPLEFWPALVGMTGGGRKGTGTNVALGFFENAEHNKHIKINFRDFVRDIKEGGVPDTGLGFLKNLKRAKDEETGEDRPQIYIQGEMDTMISSLKKNTKLGSVLRAGWDGKPIVYESGVEAIEINRPHFGLILHVQPENVLAVKKSKDLSGGTYNRVLWFFVNQEKTLATFGKKEENVRLRELYREYARQLEINASRARAVGLVTVSDETAHLFDRIIKPALTTLANAHRDLAQFTQRSLAHVLRIGSLYALIDGRTEVVIEDFQAALALVEYSIRSVVYVLTPGNTFGGLSNLAEKIKEILDEEGGEMTVNDLWDKLGHKTKKPDMETAYLDIGGRELIKFKRPNKAGTLGRPAWRLCLRKYAPDLTGAILEDLGGGLVDAEEVMDEDESPLPPSGPTIHVGDVRVTEDTPTAPQKPSKRLALPAGESTPKPPVTASQEPPQGPDEDSEAVEEVRPVRRARPAAPAATPNDALNDLLSAWN